MARKSKNALFTTNTEVENQETVKEEITNDSMNSKDLEETKDCNFYYAKIKELKNEIEHLVEENDLLKAKLVEYTEKIEKLENTPNKLEGLQPEIDQYLVKISELQFDNAKLTNQIQMLMAQNETSTQKNNVKSSKNNEYLQSISVPYNKLQKNGYSSWN